MQEVRFDADDVGREATAASDVRLRNTSRTACWLAGWPGVTFRGRGILHDCGGVPHCDPYPDKTSVFVQRRKNLPGGADRVVLQPGASTTFGITYRSPVFSYTQAYAVDIALPGDRGAAHLVLAGTDVQLAMVSRPTGGDDLDVSYGVGAFGTSARAPSS